MTASLVSGLMARAAASNALSNSPTTESPLKDLVIT